METPEQKTAKVVELIAVLILLICYAFVIYRALTTASSLDGLFKLIDIIIFAPFAAYPFLGFMALSNRRPTWITLLALALLIPHWVMIASALLEI